MLSGNLRAVIKKDYHFYGNAKSIGILPRGDRRDFGDNYLQNFKSYQERFTVARLSQLDIFTFRYKFLLRKLLRLRRVLKKEKILDDLVNSVQGWFFYQCSTYSRWIDNCSRVVIALNNFQNQNFFEGNLKTQDQVRNEGVRDQHNIPYILTQLSLRLSQEYDINISEASLFRTIRGQIKNGVLVLPNILLMLVQRQKERKLVQLEKTFKQIGQTRKQIHQITDLIAAQRNQMEEYVRKFVPQDVRQRRIAQRKIARKSAPVEIRQKKRYRGSQVPDQVQQVVVVTKKENQVQQVAVYARKEDQLQQVAVYDNQLKEQSEYDAQN